MPEQKTLLFEMAEKHAKELDFLKSCKSVEEAIKRKEQIHKDAMKFIEEVTSQ